MPEGEESFSGMSGRSATFAKPAKPAKRMSLGKASKKKERQRIYRQIIYGISNVEPSSHDAEEVYSTPPSQETGVVGDALRRKLLTQGDVRDRHQRFQKSHPKW